MRGRKPKTVEQKRQEDLVPKVAAPSEAKTKAGKKVDDYCISDPTKPDICLRGTRGCTVDHSKPVDPEVVREIEDQYREYNENG